ncbi:MAG: hypothetical protein Q4D73_05895 [Actinomycetaceae bacterium]|nr:hypothetical protein [Actinomycetaceae bacterium]
MEVFTGNISQTLAQVAQELENLYWQSTQIDWFWEGRASQEATALKAELQTGYQVLATQSAEAIFQIAALENEVRLSIFTALGGAF